MSHRLVPMFAGVALVGVLIVGLISQMGLSHGAFGAMAQPATPAPTATATSRQMHPLPPQLAFLQTMTPEQRFDHTLGGQITFQNPQGQDVVLNMVPGKVSSTTSNVLTMTPNGSTQTRSFNVTTDTWVMGYQHQGSLSAFSPGDRVIVFVIGNSVDAAAIIGPRFAGGMMGEHRGPMGRGMPTGQMPAPTTTPGQAPATATPVPSPTATP